MLHEHNLSHDNTAFICTFGKLILIPEEALDALFIKLEMSKIFNWWMLFQGILNVELFVIKKKKILSII